MPLINLIQEERLAIKRDERAARGYFALFAGAATGAVLVFLTLSFETEQAHTTAAKLDAVKQKVAPLMKQIEADEAEQAKLKPRLDTLQSATEASQRWARILDHISTQTPPQAWITGLRATGQDPTKPILASFDGAATSQTPVSEFLFRLENSPDLDNVTLKFTQEKSTNTTTQTQFQIDAEVTGTVEVKPVVEKKP